MGELGDQGGQVLEMWLLRVYLVGDNRPRFTIRSDFEAVNRIVADCVRDRGMWKGNEFFPYHTIAKFRIDEDQDDGA